MRPKIKRLYEVLVSAIAWVFGLCVFIPLSSLALLLSVFIDHRRIDGLIKFTCRMVLHAVRVKVRIEDLDRFSKDRPCLFLCNHVNIFDGFILMGYIPTLVRGVEEASHFKRFFYGPLIQRIGIIPIDRRNPRKALESLAIARDELSDGISIFILPEGGRTLDGHLKPFKRGPFILAKQAGVDIVPMAMSGAYDINRKGSLLIKPGRVTLRFGEPIAYDTIDRLDANELRSLVRERMEKIFVSPSVVQNK
jgi:1-acyl-sn-glycerol-3-phosphate acyltransferase